MTCAPATGCVRASRLSRSSAGGQLEQPSDVNSSTSTGVRAVSSPLGSGAAATQTIASNQILVIVFLSARLSLSWPLRRLEVDRHLHVVADDRRGLDHAIVLQAEVATIQLRRGAGADAEVRPLLQRWRRTVHLERHLFRDAVHRQVSDEPEVTGGDALDARGLERDGRVLGDVEEVVGPEVLVASLDVGIEA